jgi:hypothetical protein
LKNWKTKPMWRRRKTVAASHERIGDHFGEKD